MTGTHTAAASDDVEGIPLKVLTRYRKFKAMHAHPNTTEARRSRRKCAS